MRTLAFPFIHAGLLLLGGCASSRDAIVPSAPREAVSARWTVYRCESGREVAVSYGGDGTALVGYRDSTHAMRVALSASGARYAGGGYEWWTRGSGPGSTGRLSRFAGEEATASVPLETCAVLPAPR